MTTSKRSDPGRRPDLGVERTHEGSARGKGLRVAVVVSRFHEEVTGLLARGACAELAERGVDRASTRVVWVPGAFELPLVAHRLAASGEHDAVVCLGAVVRGETGHYEHVAGQAAAGLQRAALDTGVPVVFGVLTTEDMEQALARAGGEHGNKGSEAAAAAVEMADLLSQLPKPAP